MTFMNELINQLEQVALQNNLQYNELINQLELFVLSKCLQCDLQGYLFYLGANTIKERLTSMINGTYVKDNPGSCVSLSLSLSLCISLSLFLSLPLSLTLLLSFSVSLSVPLLPFLSISLCERQ